MPEFLKDLFWLGLITGIATLSAAVLALLSSQTTNNLQQKRYGAGSLLLAFIIFILGIQTSSVQHNTDEKQIANEILRDSLQNIQIDTIKRTTTTIVLNADTIKYTSKLIIKNTDTIKETGKTTLEDLAKVIEAETESLNQFTGGDSKLIVERPMVIVNHSRDTFWLVHIVSNTGKYRASDVEITVYYYPNYDIKLQHLVTNDSVRYLGTAYTQSGSTTVDGTHSGHPFAPFAIIDTSLKEFSVCYNIQSRSQRVRQWFVWKRASRNRFFGWKYATMAYDLTKPKSEFYCDYSYQFPVTKDSIVTYAKQSEGHFDIKKKFDLTIRPY